jgi:DNA sulfur modification protein DndC
MGILDSLNLNKEKIKIAKENIKKVYFMNDLPWVIGYSGGKDSTCTTQIIIETLIELKNKGTSLKKHVYIISSDTLVENPMIVGTIHKTIAAINDVAIRENLPISAHVIKPDFNNTFWAN